MKKRIIGLDIIIILVALIYSAILILGNVWTAKASVAVVKGSYGENYAKDNKLNVVTLSDSQAYFFDIRYEDFDYNVSKDRTIEISSYKGKSKKLVIPSAIKGSKVTVINKGFVESLKGVTDIFLPSTIIKFNDEPASDITVHCKSNSEIYKICKKAGWTIEEAFDSDYIDFNTGENPFNYNINDTNAEITGYMGDKKIMVIPSYINGIPVTTISMNLLGSADVIVIPDTVTSITGVSTKVIYSLLFVIELIFSVLAFIISLIAINAILPRFSKENKEYVLSSGQFIVTVLYVVIQASFSCYAIFFGQLSPYIALIISTIILALYIIAIFAGGTGRRNAIIVDKEVKEKTSTMKSIKASVIGVSKDITNPELKKKVERLEEDIRYSDPVSRGDLFSIEARIAQEIEQLKTEINSGNEEGILKQVDFLQELVDKRNTQCKAGKD